MSDPVTQPSPPPSQLPSQLNVKPATLALITGGGLAAGVLIVVGAIMPAEYNVDPLGLGKLTGLSRLWAPDAKTFAGGGAPLYHASEAPRAIHVADIPLGAAGWDEAALEYKVRMSPGESILYRWSARELDGSPAAAPVEFDMHGHDVVDEGVSPTVVDYAKGEALAQAGSLTAPMDGIFGWYFRNTGDDPLMIRLEVEGYFEVIPPGEPGNEFGIRPAATEPQ
jgi:hypothetical protein